MTPEGTSLLFIWTLIRVALPILILLGLGTLYERYLAGKTAARNAANAAHQSFAVRDMLAPDVHLNPLESPCWAIKHCPVEQRATCPAASRPGVPCWVTMQLLTGQLSDICLNCHVYKDGMQVEDSTPFTFSH